MTKNLNINLTGSWKKAEVIDRIFAMARIGAIRGHGNPEGHDVINITYIYEEVKSLLKVLPPFLSIREWTKAFGGVLKLLHL